MNRFLLSILLTVFNSAFAQTEKFIVHFDFDKYRITTEAKNSLDSLLSGEVSSIKRIDLSGHCDVIGSNAYNDSLSVKRANAVKKYLIDHNIPVAVFEQTEGFGKKQPLNQNLSDAERALNRRVEISIERNKKEAELKPEIKKDTPHKQQTLTQQIEDTSVKSGTHIILKNLNFLGGRHFLMPQSVPILAELLTALKNNPALAIEIQGHVCCTTGREDGFDEDTRTPNLSINRAKVIYQYLIEHGISPERLSYKGFGHSMPLVYPEDTEDRKMVNRRVELKILKK